MTEEDIKEFFQSSQNVVLALQETPFDNNELVLTYTTKQNIDWVVFSLFFQDNYSHTYNIVDITEKDNGRIDLKFQANSGDKTINIEATDLNYNKEKFDLFVSKYKTGDFVNMKFSCWKEQGEMAETMTIDPPDRANHPIPITHLNLRAL